MSIILLSVAQLRYGFAGHLLSLRWPYHFFSIASLRISEISFSSAYIVRVPESAILRVMDVLAMSATKLTESIWVAMTLSIVAFVVERASLFSDLAKPQHNSDFVPDLGL